jgi:hypothetical protein
MTERSLQDLANEALGVTGSASAAIFLVDAAGVLSLVAAAGVAGAPLDALVKAVQSKDHPIARTVQTGESAFDVAPVAPGGPSLRSHIALVDSASGRVTGVLALAHELPLSSDQRQAISELVHSH